MKIIMKKLLLSILTMSLLQPCYGCSNEKTMPEEPSQPNEPLTESYQASDMVIYEANPRIFATEKAFDAIKTNLDHIKGLGTTVLWLMPINDPGVLKSVNSPYCIKDYKGLNSRYGTMVDLKSLVDAAHTKGMKVILDWVANHTSWDHAWVTDHPDWYTQDAGGNVVSPREQPWNDVADLNFDNQQMQEAMIDAMKFWVQEADIDGFRCDYAEGVPESFWKKAISSLRSVKTDLLMLAEGGKVSLMNSGFDLLYGWGFHGKLKDYYGGKTTLEDVYKMNQSELNGMPEGTMRLRYTTNHDQASEVSPIACYGGERGAMSAFVIAALLEGVPLIYSSQEAAYGQSLNFFNYKVIDLKAKPAYYNELASVIKIYKESASVRGGKLSVYSTGKVSSFYRNAGEHGLLVIVNTSGDVQQMKMPMERAGTKMMNMISGKEERLPSGLTLEPYQYFILKK